MSEASVRSATVTGYCALATCGRLAEPMPAAYQQLSALCPVVVEIDHADLDLRRLMTRVTGLVGSLPHLTDAPWHGSGP